MSLWSDYETEAQFAKDFPHGVPCDEWVTRDGSKIKLRNSVTGKVSVGWWPNGRPPEGHDNGADD